MGGQVVGVVQQGAFGVRAAAEEEFAVGVDHRSRSVRGIKLLLIGI
jgi:hypothetical protein